MDTILDKAGDLAAHAREYVNNRIATVKLEAAEKSSKIVAVVIAGSIVALCVLLFLVFLGIAASILLSDWIGRPYSGSMVVSGIYLISAILLWRSREKFIRVPVMNAILQQMFHDEEDQKH